MIRKLIAAALVAAGLLAPWGARADSPPAPFSVAKVMPFMWHVCTDPAGVGCWYSTNITGTTSRPAHPYYRIRVGRLVCTKYWEPRYDLHHGHCDPLGRRRSHP